MTAILLTLPTIVVISKQDYATRADVQFYTRRRRGEELRSRAAGLQLLEPVGETGRVEYILQSFASEIVKK